MCIFRWTLSFNETHHSHNLFEDNMVDESLYCLQDDFCKWFDKNVEHLVRKHPRSHQIAS